MLTCFSLWFGNTSLSQKEIVAFLCLHCHLIVLIQYLNYFVFFWLNLMSGQTGQWIGGASLQECVSEQKLMVSLTLCLLRFYPTTFFLFSRGQSPPLTPCWMLRPLVLKCSLSPSVRFLWIKKSHTAWFSAHLSCKLGTSWKRLQEKAGISAVSYNDTSPTLLWEDFAVSSSQPSLSSFTGLIPLTSVSGGQDLAHDVSSKMNKWFTLVLAFFRVTHTQDGSLCLIPLLGLYSHRGWRTELQSASLGSRRDKIVSIKIYFCISLRSVAINKMENHCCSPLAFSLYQPLSFLPWQHETSKRENKLNYSLVHEKI